MFPFTPHTTLRLDFVQAVPLFVFFLTVRDQPNLLSLT